MRFFQRGKLKQFEARVYSGLLLLLCGFIPILAGAFYVLHDLVREEREFVEQRTHETILTEHLNTSYERTLSLIPVYVLTSRRDILDQLRATRTNMLRTLGELEVFAESDDDKRALQEIREANAKLTEISKSGIEMRIAGASSESVNDYFRWRASDYVVQLQKLLANFTRQQSIELEQARVALATTANEAVLGLGIVSALTLIFLGGVTSMIVREMRRKRSADREVAALLQRERQISTLRKENVDVVSHDLKNPIAALKLRIQLLARRSGATNPAIERDLKLAMRSVNSMESLVRDLLDHAKMDSGKLLLSPRACTAAELLGNAMARLELLAQEKGVQISLFEEPGFPTVNCDPGRIGQVLENLLGNALKFTPRGGTIRLSATYQARQWMVSVADSGPGIPAAKLEQVFERFWQDSATAKKGNGLGLAIARGIVESSGGRIWAESRAGQGAEFFFTLPLEARPTLESSVEAMPTF
jgi:signal transduction histidine kinase